MQFAFTEDQNLIRETARGFLDERATLAQLRKDMETPAGYDPELWRAIVGEMGWAGLSLPESVGGSGLGMVELAILHEELGRCLYGGPFLASVGFASALLLECPPSTARDAALSKLASGDSIAAAAVTGDSGRADRAAVRVELHDASSGAQLRGHAAFVLNGHCADFFVVVAHDRRAGHAGLALVTVAAATKGLGVSTVPAMDSTRPYARLTFDAVAPQEILASGEHSVERGLQIAQVALAAEQLGSMQAVFDLTTGYVAQRVQFGRPIGSFQAIKHRLADMLVIVEAARSAVYYAACVVDEYRADPTNVAAELAEAAALVKVYCSSGLHDVAGNAIQLHGGIGFTWEYDAHLFFKRARSTSNLLGTPQFHRERIAGLIDLGVATEAK